MKINGFGLAESIVSLLILLIAITILASCIQSLNHQKEMIFDERIEKEWFYTH